jgi:hypothetical protein
MVDESTGQKYFYYESTGESAWELPADLVPYLVVPSPPFLLPLDLNRINHVPSYLPHYAPTHSYNEPEIYPSVCQPEAIPAPRVASAAPSAPLRSRESFATATATPSPAHVTSTPTSITPTTSSAAVATLPDAHAHESPVKVFDDPPFSYDPMDATPRSLPPPPLPLPPSLIPLSLPH